MALDVYQSCLGGMPKKIKFCQCGKDMLGDLGKIVDAINGGQRAGAMSHINRMLESKGNRACLLALKGQIQLQLDDYEGLAKTADEFSQAHPENPIASGLSAVAAATRGEVRDAVQCLQTAFGASDKHIHQVVYDALEIVSQLLIHAGDILAARAHLSLLAALTPRGEDNEAMGMLLRMLALPSVPVLLKEQLELTGPPDDVLWRDACQAALDLAGSGVWAEALDRFMVLTEELPSEPVIWRNAAILSGHLGRMDEAADAWHQYAALERVDLDDAVEAEALAQVLSIDDQPTIDEVTQVYLVSDSERVLERLLSEERVDKISGDLSSLATEESPAPKAAFWILDRKLPAGADDIGLHEVPNVLGQAFLYGRETDCDARIEFVTTKTEDFESKCEIVRELLGDFGGEVESEETSGEVSASAAALTWRWRLPEGLPQERRLSLIEEKHADVHLNVWPETPLARLDGKCPAEVAADPTYRVRLLASILLLELAGENNNSSFDYNQLRAKFGLPTQDDLSPDGVDVRQLPLMRLHLLVPEQLSDEQLLTAYGRAWINRSLHAIRRLAAEVLKRPALKSEINMGEVHYALSSVASNPNDALESILRAQQASSDEGHSPARWMLHELDLRMMRSEPEECQRLIAQLQTRHINEPGIGEALYSWLVRVGAITQDGRPTGPHAPQQPPMDTVAEPAPAAGEIWTPGGSAAAPPGEDKPGLWVPGMD